MSVLKLVVVIITITTSTRCQAEQRIICWTYTDPDRHKSYLMYYRSEPEQFIFDLLSQSNVDIKGKTYNSSRIEFGAVAADNKQPMSVFVHDKLTGDIHVFEEDLRSLKPIFKGCSTQVEDIAVDWLSNNIYYTDPILGIGIVSYQGHFNIIIRKVAALHGIDVDPMSGLLFYADGDSGHIHQADLTGEHQRILSVPATGRPTALVTDAVNKILYWLDEGTQYIQSWNYDTSEFKQIWTRDDVVGGAFVSMDVYKNYLFIAMANRDKIHVIATNSLNRLAFPADNGESVNVYGIAISAPERQPNMESSCNIDNGGCDHICIHESNVQNRCLCQFGYKLDGDKCKAEPLLDNFLMFVDSSSGTTYQVNLNDSDHDQFRALSISPSVSIRPQLRAYDPKDERIYWSDKNQHEIWRLDLLRSGSEKMFTDLGSGTKLETMAIDPEERYLYFIDNGLKQIARININTKIREFILQFAYEELPLSIVLDVKSRYVYWIDGGNNPKIERANMDNGRERVTLVSTDIQKPAGLAVDLEGRYIYWLDKGSKSIMRADMHGQNSELFIPVTDDGASGLAVDKDYIYLAEKRVLTRIRKRDHIKQAIGPVYFVIISGVTYHKYQGVRLSKANISFGSLLLIGFLAGGFFISIVIISAIAITLRHLRRRNNSRSGTARTTRVRRTGPTTSSRNRTDGQRSKPHNNRTDGQRSKPQNNRTDGQRSKPQNNRTDGQRSKPQNNRTDGQRSKPQNNRTDGQRSKPQNDPKSHLPHVGTGFDVDDDHSYEELRL